MHADCCAAQTHAEHICGIVEEQVETEARELGLDTDEIAHFWRHFTEASMLRLVRLNPEMVTRVEG